MAELTLEELQAQLEALQKDNAAKDAALAEKDAKIADLSQTVESIAPSPVVLEANGKKYQFAYPSFTHDDRAYKSKEFAAAASAAGEKGVSDPSSLNEEEINTLKVLSRLVAKVPGVLVELK